MLGPEDVKETESFKFIITISIYIFLRVHCLESIYIELWTEFKQII